MPCLGSDSIVRLSISAFRAEDPGSNPGRSTNFYLSWFTKKWLFSTMNRYQSSNMNVEFTNDSKDKEKLFRRWALTYYAVYRVTLIMSFQDFFGVFWVKLLFWDSFCLPLSLSYSLPLMCETRMHPHARTCTSNLIY